MHRDKSKKRKNKQAQPRKTKINSLKKRANLSVVIKDAGAE
jgi:hypothetical protein